MKMAGRILVKVRAKNAQEAMTAARDKRPNYVPISASGGRVVYRDYIVKMRPKKR